MNTYQTVVVGTDGSESSLRAVDRAGEIAAEWNAKLFIATGYFPPSDDLRAADAARVPAHLIPLTFNFSRSELEMCATRQVSTRP